MNWKVDVSNYMGHKYEAYKNKLLAKAMTKPSEYYDAQSYVIETLNTEIAELVYQIFYDLLTEGILPGGGALGPNQLKIGTEVVKPNWPSQAASAFALNASNEIDDIISKCVEIILPKDHLDIAKMKLNEKSKSLTIT